MKKIFKKIFNSIKNFFNRVADQEAERVFEFYSQVLAGKPNKGGGKLK